MQIRFLKYILFLLILVQAQKSIKKNANRDHFRSLRASQKLQCFNMYILSKGCTFVHYFCTISSIFLHKRHE